MVKNLKLNVNGAGRVAIIPSHLIRPGDTVEVEYEESDMGDGVYLATVLSIHGLELSQAVSVELEMFLIDDEHESRLIEWHALKRIRPCPPATPGTFFTQLTSVSWVRLEPMEP